MLRWLLQSDADIHATDQFDTTALMNAVDVDDLDCANILLAADAKIEADTHGSILGRTSSRPMIRRLLDAGADPANLSYEAQRNLLGLGDVDKNALAAVSPDDFSARYKRVFGKESSARRKANVTRSTISRARKK